MTVVFLVHGLVGASLGYAAGRPDLGLALGVVSHAALDAVPHADYSRAWQGAADVVAGTAVAYGVASLLTGGDPGSLPALWAGFAGGVLPDLEVAFNHLVGRGKKRLLFPSHSGLVVHRQVKGWVGIATQLVAAAAACLLFLIT